MSGIQRTLALVASVLVSVLLLSSPAAATPEPAPTFSISRHCIPNRITVVEVALANYPPGSTLTIADSAPVPALDGTTTFLLTTAVRMIIDSSAGTDGDLDRIIRPKPQCRLPRWK